MEKGFIAVEKKLVKYGPKSNIYLLNTITSVPMLLNPNEIEPTFLNWIRSRRGRVLFLL